MKIFVHAGMPKTGSSSIQKTLAANRELLRSQGVVYPRFGPDTALYQKQLDSHWMLAAQIHEDPEHFQKIGRSTETNKLALCEIDALSQLHTALASAAPDDVVVLSSENFGAKRSTTGLQDILYPVLSKYSSDISCLAYARPPKSHFPSSVQQRIKRAEIKGICPDTWMSTHVTRYKNLEHVFGTTLTIRLFDRSLLKSADVVADMFFCLEQFTGRKIHFEPQLDANVGYSVNACSILLGFLKHPVPFDLEDYRTLKKHLTAFDSVTSHKKINIPLEWRAKIDARHAAEWNEIVTRSTHSEEEKSKFILPSAVADGEIGEIAVLDHFAKVLDAPYRDGFAAFLRKNSENGLAVIVERSTRRLRRQAKSR